MKTLPGWKDNILFTPGPLTTSRTVKQAMLRDLGSRDYEFIAVVKRIREGLLTLAEAANGDYEAIPLQGSGTYAVEAVFSSAVPPKGKVLILINGAYGKRMAAICRVLGIDVATLEYPENAAPETADVVRALQEQQGITHVAAVHCETTTGILNPIQGIGAAVRAAGARFIVDAMSSFGAVPLNAPAAHIDYLVSSANKCIEGVPGFAFVIARREALLETKGWARSVCLNLLEQWQGLESNGQFRFTPPTHALLAFDQALAELFQEGGVAGRARRYYDNYKILVEGMQALGFKTYLSPELQGYIITSFLYPQHDNWQFEAFYKRLNDRGFVIYPGKVSDADCFRIGSIGRIFPADVRDLLAAIRDALADMQAIL